MSTSIEWTSETWNPVRGCSKVSAGCTNCYAMKQAHRFGGEDQPYEGLTKLVKGKGPQWTGEVDLIPDMLVKPLHWSEPRRVFVNSMSDLFHEDVPFEFVDMVFAVMAITPRHTYQVLTKRPERMAAYLSVPPRELGLRWGDQALSSPPVPYGGRVTKGVSQWAEIGNALQEGTHPWPLPNVWLGTSVEDQPAAEERVPHLLRTPAAVRFVSCEPLLGAVFLDQWLLESSPPHPPRADGLHWIIAGGESGPGARPCFVPWIRELVDQGRFAGVPVFVKQLGARPIETRASFAARCAIPIECEHGYDVCPKCDAGVMVLKLGDRKGGDPNEWPEDLRVREFPETKGVTP